MPAHLTTDNIALRERPSYWNYLVSSVLGRLNTIPERKGEFTGSIAYSHLSSIPIAKVSSTQLQVVRPEKYIDDPAEDFFKINFQLIGQATLRQRGQTALLEPGNWVIYDNTSPYELSFHSDYQQLLFLVPRRRLLGLMPTVDLQLAKSLSSRAGMGRMLFHFVANALDESETISAEIQAHTAQLMLDMLLLGLADSAENPTPLPNSTRFTQCQQFIAMHLSDPELSAEMLAQHLHLSKRSIQQQFANHNTTVNRSIWQQRIERCKRDLGDPRLTEQPIQHIAAAWGFRSNAHFTRLFKQSVGCTPRTYRQQQLIALSQ